MRIDTHLHLWDPALGVYDWLTPELGQLYAAFGPEDAAPELRRAGIDRAVLVQAADSPLDTEHLLGIAAANDWVTGVVGWIDLEDPAGAAAALDGYQAGVGGEFLCGIRQLVHDDPRDDVLALPAAQETARVLAGRGIPLDVPDAFPRQLAGATALARGNDALVVVVDHLAKPPRVTDAMSVWERQLREIAALPNVVAKISGLATPTAGFTVAELRQVVDLALEVFGPDRLMIGSDWPVSLSGADYAATMAVLEALVAELTASEQDALWWRTAAGTYRLDPQLTDSKDVIACSKG